MPGTYVQYVTFSLTSDVSAIRCTTADGIGIMSTELLTCLSDSSFYTRPVLLRVSIRDPIGLL